MTHPAPATCRRILLVDDEPIVLQALREGLKQGGFETVAVSSATEGLQELRRLEFAAIISDYRLNDGTGLQFFDKAKQIQPDSSRVLITAYLSLETLIKSINEGEIFRFLAKPWFYEELITTATNAIGRYALVKDNQLLLEQTVQLNRQLASANTELESRMSELRRQKVELDQAHASLQANFDRSLELCYRILNTFEPWLGSRIRRIAAISEALIQTSYFTDVEKRTLRSGGWLCDLGMVGLPRALLSKYRHAGGMLTESELRQIESHVILSQALASFVFQVEAVGDTIRAHHERFDGRGYPDGLAGEDIPWTARCLAAVVAYCEQAGPESAGQFLLAGSGTRFDPEAVRLVLKVVEGAKLPRQFDQMTVDELQPGMVLASGIYSPNGLLLVAEDQVLTAATIAKIRNYNRLNQVNQRLLVYT